MIYDSNDRISNCGRIQIAVSCRLEYRRGIDLLIGIIPKICKKYKNVDFVIAGDGPDRVKIEEMRERLFLIDRVNLLGKVKHRFKFYIFVIFYFRCLVWYRKCCLNVTFS